MAVVIGVIASSRFMQLHQLAMQNQYAHQLSECFLCQLRGSSTDCTVETAIHNISIVAKILGAVALGTAPYFSIPFLTRYWDFVKMANLLCCVCRQQWSCVSTSVEGNPHVQTDAMWKSPQENPTDYNPFHWPWQDHLVSCIGSTVCGCHVLVQSEHASNGLCLHHVDVAVEWVGGCAGVDLERLTKTEQKETHCQHIILFLSL